MKKIIAGVALLSLLSSCGNKSAKIDFFAGMTHEVDSVRQKTDSAHLEKTVKTVEAPQPTEADESFDDFVYNFTSEEAFQHQRIKFPLTYLNEGVKSNIEERFWKFDYLFFKQSYYTLLFDHEEDMDLVGDTSLTSVQVEWLFIKTRTVKRYFFERIKGAWMLESIGLSPVEPNEGEDFLEFFNRFVVDSVFQCKRVKKPLDFVTTDPDDDFSVLETELDLNQWLAFKPTLPSDRLSNINYGQRNDSHSPTKILALKGVGNGFSNILYFRKKSGEWELYKFEDVSI